MKDLRAELYACLNEVKAEMADMEHPLSTEAYLTCIELIDRRGDGQRGAVFGRETGGCSLQIDYRNVRQTYEVLASGNVLLLGRSS